MPLYSYSLPLSSDYSGELCVGLGDWEGDNTVAIEWDGLHSRLQLAGKAGINQLLQPEKREGRSSGIVIYSDQPVMPQLMEHGCAKLENRNQVTTRVDWPQEVAEELIPAQTAMNAGE